MRWSSLVLLALWSMAGCGAKKAEYEALANPMDADAWEKVGNRYRSSFRRERAMDAYREAVRIDPSRSHLAKRLSARPSNEAKEMRREAMRNPSDDEMWGDLGDLLRYDGDEMGARQAYLRAFRIDPQDSEWHNALVQLGAGATVIEVAASNLREGDDESHGDYADLLHLTGDVEGACEHWRRAAELDPYDEEWINHASECGYEIPEDYDPYGADTGSYPGLGYLGGEGGAAYDGLPGADDIEGLVDRMHNDASLLVRLGQAYLAADDDDKAEETLWSALLVSPTDEEILQSYLVATSKTRRQALELLRDTFPEDDEVIGTLADHYLDLGMRDRARDLYNLAHNLDEDDPEWQAKRDLMELVR